MVNYDRNDEKLIIKVKDTGVGMSASDQAKIFTLFGKISSHKMINKHGIGLGLNICKKILNSIGGSITCESNQGMGTTFTVIFPAKIYSTILSESIAINEYRFEESK